jgi:AcrR family transcriptional regulator
LNGPTNNGYSITITAKTHRGSDFRRRPLGPPGSPAWWSSRPAATVYRRGRPPRSLERIVSVALEIVDETGTDAFSMRLLADRLRSGTATLYRHLAGKDELMSYVVDRILGEVDIETDADALSSTTWQVSTARGASAFYEVLRSHPNALPLLVSQVPVGPNALINRERSMAVFLACGFPLDLAARAYTAVAHYVVGFALQQHAPGAPQPEDAARLRDFYRALDAETYPATVAAADELTSVPLDEEFRFGLQLVLDGIELARTAAHAEPAS